MRVNTFKATVWKFQLAEYYNSLYLSGVFAYIKPELRAEITLNYKTPINEGNLMAFHIFVGKPFIRL